MPVWFLYTLLSAVGIYYWAWPVGLCAVVCNMARVVHVKRSECYIHHRHTHRSYNIRRRGCACYARLHARCLCICGFARDAQHGAAAAAAVCLCTQHRGEHIFMLTCVFHWCRLRPYTQQTRLRVVHVCMFCVCLCTYAVYDGARDMLHAILSIHTYFVSPLSHPSGVCLYGWLDRAEQPPITYSCMHARKC